MSVKGKIAKEVFHPALVIDFVATCLQWANCRRPFMMPISVASFAQRLSALIVLVAASRLDAHPTEPYFDGGLIRFDATIDSQPAALFYDTGATGTALFSSGAQRLKIPTQASEELRIAGEKVATEQSAEVDFKMLGYDTKTRFRILPFRHRLDGVLGWRSVPSHLLIDGYEQRVRPLRMSPTEPDWQLWKIDEKSSQLFFFLTDGGKPMGRVFVDTGVASGLRLSPALWTAWKSRHPESGTTLETFRYPIGEAMVSEVAWTAEFRLGDLTFHNLDIGTIPSSKNGVAIDGTGKEFIATIGTGALRHLQLIVSSATGEIWTRTVSGVQPHNRLGAVFLPVSVNDPRLSCRLLPKTPAAESGLKEGDVLIGIEGIDAADGKSLGKADLIRVDQLFSQPAGTELKLRVDRDGATVGLRAVLRDLLNTRQSPAVGSDADGPAKRPELNSVGGQITQPK